MRRVISRCLFAVLLVGTLRCDYFFGANTLPDAGTQRDGGANPSGSDSGVPNDQGASCLFSADCASNEYCRAPSCDSLGHCRPRAEPNCLSEAVCACDGNTYSSECAGAASGNKLSHFGSCSSGPIAGGCPWAPEIPTATSTCFGAGIQCSAGSCCGACGSTGACCAVGNQPCYQAGASGGCCGGLSCGYDCLCH